MYEFDEELWDRGDDDGETGAEQQTGFMDGWLIESAEQPGNRLTETCGARYLQIATGQWCSAQYATFFSHYSAAVIYAKDFGHVVGKTVRIVRHRY